MTGIVDGTYRYTGYVADRDLVYSATTGRTIIMDNTPPALIFT